MTDEQTVEAIKADNDKQFILEMTKTFMLRPDLKERYESPDLYILVSLSELVESTKMADSTAKRIVGKLYPTLNLITNFK